MYEKVNSKPQPSASLPHPIQLKGGRKCVFHETIMFHGTIVPAICLKGRRKGVFHGTIYVPWHTNPAICLKGRRVGTFHGTQIQPSASLPHSSQEASVLRQQLQVMSAVGDLFSFNYCHRPNVEFTFRSSSISFFLTCM